LINTSPEPVSNWTASISEDLLVIGGVWAALNHPWLFIALLGLSVLLMIWLLPKIWFAIKALARRIRSFISHDPQPRIDPPESVTDKTQ